MKITVNVIPNSKNSEIIKISENTYKIKVDAPASKNKANKRMIEILSEHFKVSKSSISIIRGMRGKEKIIKINL